MGGFTDFQAIVGSLKTAGDIVTAVITAEKALDKAELKLRLAEVIAALADARMKTADMQADLDSLTKELAELRSKLAFKATMKFDAPYYWSHQDGNRDGPFCAACWDGREHLAIHLYQAQPGFLVVPQVREYC